MENKTILESAGKELEKRVSLRSNLHATIDGVKSNLLDVLILGNNETTRENFAKPIKAELEEKIKIAKEHKPPREKYIENMTRVIADLDKRMNGEKTDDNRKDLLNLDKSDTFDTRILEKFVDEILKEAMSRKDIWRTQIYQKLTSNPKYITEILTKLEEKKGSLTDATQIANIESIINTFSKKGNKLTPTTTTAPTVTPTAVPATKPTTKPNKAPEDMDANDVKEGILEKTKNMSWEEKVSLLAMLGFKTAKYNTTAGNLLDTSEAKASLALVNFLFESLGNDKAKEVQDQVRDTIFSKMIKEFLDDTTDESSKEGINQAIDAIMKDLFQENTFVDNITKYIDTNKKSKEKKKKDFAKTLEDLSKKYLVVKKTKEQEEEETLNRFVEGFMELAKTKTPLTEKEVYDNPNCQEMMKQAGADYAPYFQKIIEALEAKKPSVDDITKNNIDTITKTLTAIINEGADNITVFNPDDDETKKADDADTNKQKAKDNVDENIDKEHIIIRDLNNSVDPHYMLALKNKIEAMKPGEEIILATNQGLIKLTKMNDFGFKCTHVEVDQFKPYIDAKDSRVSNENLYRFLGLREVKPTLIPTPIPVPPTPEELELNAVISDMGTDVHRERVSFETEEELREKYKNLARYNLPKRAYLFLSRGAKRKRMIKAKMNAMAGKAFSITGDAAKDAALNDKTGNASDRHEIELKHNLDMVQNKLTLQNPQVNNLCKQFLDGTITEAQFQPQFNAIIDGDAAIQAALRGEKVTHIGTNILEKLKLQKAKWDLSKKIEAEFNKTPIDMNAIDIAITQYIKDFQVNPEFMKDYEDFINSVPGAKNKLDTYFRHQGAVMKMQATNIKMNIDILVKGKSAYQIDNKDRQKGRAYKTGKILDKLPRWVQTVGFVGISVGTGLLTGGLGTVAAAAITTGVTASSVGGLNAIKKWTHYTKEQNTHEKDMVTDYRKEQAKLKERQERALNGKWYQWKTYKARRQLALYDQTTQENIFISDTMSDTITDLASKIGQLDAREQSYMQKNLIQGWARLKYYREMGHNFLASNDKEKIEKDMNRLEKAIILGAGKLGKTLPDIEAMQATDDTGANLTYLTVRKDLESSYKKSLIQFKRERRRLAAKYGVGTAVLSAGMSIGMQYLLGTGIFGNKGVAGVEGQSTTVNAHDHFDLGKSNLLDTGARNHMYNTTTTILKDQRLVDGSNISIHYGAGTDLTPVIPGRLTEAVYTSKINHVINNINHLNLDTGTKQSLSSYLNTHPWESGWSNATPFHNNYLQGMRCAEFIEQQAKALAASGHHNINLNLVYDPSLDVAGKTMHSAAERVINANYNIQTPGVPGTPGSSRGKFLQFPIFFNTFEDVAAKEKERKNNQEQARTPAPSSPQQIPAQ